MLKFKNLWQGEFISVISPIEIEYECINEHDSMQVLPLIIPKNAISIDDAYLIIRKEFCPPYMIKDKLGNKFFYTIISGMMDKENETPEQTMSRELIEEAGIKLLNYDIIYNLNDIPYTKVTSSRLNLFIISIKNFERVEATGDGTENEKISKSIAVKLKNMDNILKKPNADFLLHSAYNILKNNLNKIKL